MIYDALQQVLDESSDATSYMHAMQRFETIVIAVYTQYTLGFVRPLSFSTQVKSPIRRLKTSLMFSKMRKCFDKLYNCAVSIAASFEDVPSDPRTVGRQRHRADSSSDKARAQDYYRLNNNFPFLDHMISP
ncbi:hypothetical protein MAR_010920 [Mya arenaria]|uniref:Uncharacterized protein n=1 Tax=Mya arenaria TaxID=6604 RepID=A0ABY7FWK3_MYAAR|nr:hypothetical protein MAR_010920 [Mya arenaria]